MQLEYLKYAVVSSKCGTLAEAAQLLHVQPSTLSSAIRNIEAEFNIQIFTRSRLGISLTEDGKAFAAQAETICHLYDELCSSFSARDEKSYLAVNNICNSRYGVAIAGRFQAATAEQNISSTLYLSELHRRSIVSAIVDGRFNLGIAYVFSDETQVFLELLAAHNLDHRVIGTDVRYLYFNEDHPLAAKATITAADLENVHFALTEKGVYEMEKNSSQIHIRHYTVFSSYAQVRLAVEQNKMCSFLLSDTSPDDWFTRGTSIRKAPVADISPETAQHILVYRKNRLSKAERVLMKCINEVFEGSHS